MGERSSSSSRWKARQARDPFVKRAQLEGLRSRASFKLTELHKRHRLFKPGMRVLELGSAPGGWTQVLQPLLGKEGRLVAVDCLPMVEVPNVTFIQGDIRSLDVQAAIEHLVSLQSLDWIVSDMSPNLSGIRDRDQALSLELNGLCLHIAKRWLKPGGGMLLKTFHGQGLEALQKEIKQSFRKLTYCKPEASRSGSREEYVLARDFYW